MKIKLRMILIIMSTCPGVVNAQACGGNLSSTYISYTTSGKTAATTMNNLPSGYSVAWTNGTGSGAPSCGNPKSFTYASFGSYTVVGAIFSTPNCQVSGTTGCSRTQTVTVSSNSSSSNSVLPYSSKGRHEGYADMDGDNKADRVWIPYGKTDIYVALSTGSQFTGTKKWNISGVNSYSSKGWHEDYADMNGDGKADRAWIPYGKAKIYVALSNGNSFNAPQQWNISGVNSYSSKGWHEDYADMNGDGKADRTWIPYGKTSIYVALSNGSGFGSAVSWPISGQVSYSSQGRYEGFSDMNGDGKADRVWIPSGKTDIYVALSTGNGFGAPSVWPIQGIVSYSTDGKHEGFADINGDNKSDRIWIPAGSQEPYVALSTGSTFSIAQQRTISGVNSYSSNGWHEDLADVTGDGKTDKAWIPYGETKIRVFNFDNNQLSTWLE